MLPDDVLEFVAAHRDGTVELLRALVAIDSVTGRETELAEYCARWLNERGVAARLSPCKGRQNLVAEVGGATEPTLIVSGHLDTVPADASAWSRDPWEPAVVDGRVYGLGTSDLKASLASAMVAATFARERSLDGRLMLSFTIEEETTGDGTRLWLDEAVSDGSVRPDRSAAVVVEPTGLGHISLGNRGTCFASVRVAGEGGHGSRPHLARNPIEGVQALLATLPELRARIVAEHSDPDLGPSQITPTSIAAGAAARVNMIPESAELTLDCRVNVGLYADGFALFRDELDRWLEAARALELDVSWELKYPREGHKLAQEHPLARLGLDVLRADLGISDAEFRYTPAGNDAVFFGQHGIPALNKVGPGRPECAHRADEFVEIESLVRGVSFFIQMARRFRREVFATEVAT